MTALPLPTSTDAAPGVAGDAYARVRRLAIRGQLAPGARVSEGELAGRLGVSRTPVREAMRRLLAEGLLVPSGGGARPRLAVAPVSAADVTELYRAAGALEGVAARQLSALSAGDRRTLTARLREREAQLRRAARTRPLDYDRLFESHDAFHRALMDACAGPATRVLLDTLRPRLDRYEWLYAPLIGPDFSATFAEHAAIIRAAQAGDGAACERAVRKNWFAGGERLAASLDRLESRRR
jgi:DNA-binding GntR family transcriptional regulator